MTLDLGTMLPRTGPAAAVLLLSLFLAPAVHGGIIERCLDEVITGKHDADADLCVVCPGLAAAMRRQAVVPMLDQPVRCPLGVAEVADVAAFLQDAAATPSPQALAAGVRERLLAEIALKPEAEAQSWWERVKQWLRQWFSGDDDTFPPWLEEFLQNISFPAWLGEIVFQFMLILLLLLTLFIVVNELRVLRWRRWQARERLTVAPDADTAAPVLTLADVHALPRSAQAGALVRYVIARLIAAGRLADRRDRTNRELARELRMQQAAEAANFSTLINGAELAVYGGRSLDEAGAARLWRDAEEILARCDRPSTVAAQ